MSRSNTIRMALCAATLCACTRAPESAPPPADTHTDAEPAVSERVELPAGVRRNLGVTFARVELRDVARTLRVPGAFELRPLARHEYRMALPGRVKLLVDQYQRVEPGAPLYSYQSPAWPELMHEIVLGEQAMLTAQAEIGVAAARLTEVRAQLELARTRIEALAQADFRKVELEVEAAGYEASLPRLEAELQLARTELANAERTRAHALHRAASASGIPESELEQEIEVEGGARTPRYLTIDRIVVRAVEGGVIEALAVTDGAFVEPPMAVLSTVDPEQVRFRGVGLQADLARFAAASAVRVVPPPAPGRASADGVAARLELGLEAHPEQRTIALIATPEHSEPWMRPGVSAFLELVVAGGGAPALAVPRAAVVQDGLEHVLFRRDPADPDTVVRIEADLGTSDGEWVVLESGVMRGDEVVLAGAYELKLATQRSGATGGGHVHADGSQHADH